MPGELVPQDSQSHDTKMRWDIIIVTGIAAALVLVLAWVLVGQARDYLASLNETLYGTATPPPAATPPPVLALRVPQESAWSVRVEVELPDGTSRVYENSGVGYLVIPPNYEAPPGSRTHTDIMFQITFMIPDLRQGGLVIPQPYHYGTLGAYLDALPRSHYAVYDANNRFMGLWQEADIAKLPGLRVEEFQPDE